MNKIYVSGKITGIEAEAPAIFEAAENKLRGEGWEPINPLKIPQEHDQSWHSYMKADIKALCDCSYIYMLKNWHDSKGAIIEHTIAMWLGIQVVYEA